MIPFIVGDFELRRETLKDVRRQARRSAVHHEIEINSVVSEEVAQHLVGRQAQPALHVTYRRGAPRNSIGDLFLLKSDGLPRSSQPDRAGRFSDVAMMGQLFDLLDVHGPIIPTGPFFMVAIVMDLCISIKNGVNEVATVTVGEICEVIGRKVLAQRVGVRPTAVSNAVVDGQFPARWYFVVEALCREHDIECPKECFTFITLREDAA